MRSENAPIHGTRLPRTGAAALAALMVVTCGGTTDPGSSKPSGTYGGGTLTPSSVNVNSADVEVDAADYETVQLRLRTTGEPDEATPSYPIVDGHADLPVLGLLAGHDYSIDVLMTAGSAVDSVDSFSLSTPPLPDWIPDIGIDGAPVDGFIGLAHPGGPIIVDGRGRVRWYVQSEDPILNNFTAHPTGEYTVYGTADGIRQFRVLDERGEVVRHIGCVERDARFHDIRVLAGGDYWIMCDHPIPTDLSERGGAADGTVNWTTLQHVDADGTLLFEFDTSEHFSLDDIDPGAFEGTRELNITHGNAIALDTDGGILVSWRSLGEITKIDPATGEVVWRLGGRANQFAITDPTRVFDRQHGLRVIGPGEIQFFDNGTEAPSRLVRYVIDEQDLIAEIELEYTDPSGAFTLIGGSTDLLPGGDALVSYGPVGLVVGVDGTGERTFALTGLDGNYIFRAFYLPSLYASERRAQ